MKVSREVTPTSEISTSVDENRITSEASKKNNRGVAFNLKGSGHVLESNFK